MKEMLEEVKRSHMHVRKNGATENYCQCNKSHAHRDTETTHSHIQTSTLAHPLTFKGRIDIAYIVAADGGANQPVGVRGECCIELGIIVGHLVDGLNLIEVERKLAGDAAVHARLQIRCPILADHVFATAIVLAHACHTRVDRLAAVDVLHGMFAEEEVHKVSDVEGAHKVGFWQGERKNERRKRNCINNSLFILFVTDLSNLQIITT